MKTKAFALAAFMFAASLFAAAPPLYTSGATGIAVTQANAVVTFTDNHSGGTAAAFKARAILVRSAVTSANTCMIDFADSVATTADVPLAPGAAISWPMLSGYTPENGVASIGVICATGQTATFYVEATR